MEKLIVVYRNNDLFEKYMPAILSHVPISFLVEKIVYPAGTELSHVAADLPGKFPHEEFYGLFDRTCDEVLRKVSGAEWEKLGHVTEYGDPVSWKKLKTIDELFWEATKKIIGVDGYTPGSEEGFELGFKRLLGFLCESEPPSIFVVSRCVTDHLSGELREKYRGGLSREDDEDRFVSFLEGALRELYSSAVVKVVRECSETEKGEGVLIVADRHCRITDIDTLWDITEWPHKAQLFLLPFENAIAHLTTLGKLAEQFDAQALYNDLSLKEKSEPSPA